MKTELNCGCYYYDPKETGCGTDAYGYVHCDLHRKEFDLEDDTNRVSSWQFVKKSIYCKRG